jgi:16S rRNA (uracil1498-N3)-methyltransferase
VIADDDLSLRRASAAHVFVAAEDLTGDGAIAVDEFTGRHLIRALRLRDGEAVSVTDGSGRWRPTRFMRAGSTALLEPDGPVHEQDRAALATIAAAMPKGDRLDLLVQKTTELGVDRLVLLHCERSVVRWKGDRVERQLTRLQRIADEACRQSRRVWRASVEGPLDALSVLPACAVAEPGGRPIAAGDVSVAIGPEGGWSEGELAVAGDAVDLGTTVLRTETAAMAAATLMMACR